MFKRISFVLAAALVVNLFGMVDPAIGQLVQVTVPDVVGMGQVSAIVSIMNAGLLPGETTTEYSNTVQEGYVISQDPSAGTSVTPLTHVGLTISLGPEMIEVPDVVGMGGMDAWLEMESAGLDLDSIPEFNDTVPLDHVISQDPVAGTVVPAGSTVVCALSMGPEFVVVPDLVGMTKNQAYHEIAITTDFGIEYIYEFSDTVPLDHVISQDPAAGTLVFAHSVVYLTTSLGPAESDPVVLPDVVGMNYLEAQLALSSAGGSLHLQAYHEYSDTVPEGHVISQNPSGGTSVPAGSTVVLTISDGPEMVVVPDVVGMYAGDAYEATKMLSVILEYELSDTVPLYYVISQSLAAGTLVPVDSLLTLTLSDGPEIIVLPDVVGMNLFEEALVVLYSAGNLWVTNLYVHSDTVPEGCVISQDPSGGTSVPSGSTVFLTVSLGPAGTSDPVVVPDVVGMSENDADSEITSASLGVSHSYEHSDTVQAGYVISQEPSAGTSVDAGSLVHLTVSLGPAGTGLVVVPDVVGMSENDADSEITSAGLEVSHSYKNSDTVPAGYVISQEPSAGTSVTEGFYVDLTVSQGPSVRGPYYVDTRATGNNDGSSWADAFNRLQDALEVAADGDEILVAQGVYKPDRGRHATPGDRRASFRLVNSVAIRGGYAGSSSPNPDSRDIARYETILSGDLTGNDRSVADPSELVTEPTLSENSLHVVTAVNCDQTTVLDGVTITAGYANDPLIPGNRGAGLLCNPASLTLVDCTFICNAATEFGAGMYNHYNSHSEPNLISCTFLENAAKAGAGLYSHSTCNSTLTDCLFMGNVADGGSGAAVSIYKSLATATDCRFTDNSAVSGGAVNCYGSEATVTNCTFEGNLAQTHGGAIRDTNSVLMLADCLFISNVAERGGAASFQLGSMVEMIGCRFIYNEAGVHGGAIYNHTVVPLFAYCSFVSNVAGNSGGAVHNYGSPLSLINCNLATNAAAGGAGAIFNNNSEAVYCGSVFSANSAVGRGGAVNNVNGKLPSYSVNCTFVGNSSEDSGGATADVNSVHVMTNSILWGNSAPVGPQALVRNDMASLTISYCDIEGGQPDVYVVNALLTWGSGNLAVDPVFVDADGPDNILGTADDQLSLSAGSPCIDAGDNTEVPEDEGDINGDGDIYERLPLDATGNARFINDSQTVDTGIADLLEYGDVVDMGAYEFQDFYSGNLQGMILPHVAYINPHNMEAAVSFQSLILSYGCSATLIDWADVETAQLDSYDLIVIGNTLLYHWAKTEIIDAIENSGKPIIGLGDGGSSFFGRLGLDIGYPNGGHTNQTSIRVIDTDNPLFSVPFVIDIPEDRVLQLYTESSNNVAMYRPSVPETVTIFGTYSSYYPLAMEQDRYVLWGYTESPLKMTEEGKLLFINFVIRAANRAWGN